MGGNDESVGGRGAGGGAGGGGGGARGGARGARGGGGGGVRNVIWIECEEAMALRKLVSTK